MTAKKISADHLKQLKLQDKTDWQRVYRTPQATADRQAQDDPDNPVLAKGRTRRLKDKP